MLICCMEGVYVLEQPRSSLMLYYKRMRETLLLLREYGVKEPILVTFDIHSYQTLVQVLNILQS